MTAPTIENLPVRIPDRTVPPRLVHISCVICSDDTAFCGIDTATLQPVIPRPKKATCVVCVDLHDGHDWTHGGVL